MNLTKVACEFYKKYKKPLVLVAIAILAYHVYKSSIIQEGLLGGGSGTGTGTGTGSGTGTTSCTQFSNCNDCINGQVTNSSSLCYWINDIDPKTNKIKGCGSFEDPGYSRTCSSTDTGTSSGTSSCPKCASCPTLTLLKTPTFITAQ